MTYVCNDCGNHERFKAIQETTNYCRDEVFVDGEGDVLDYGDSDVYDSDSGDTDNYTCQECESEDVDWFDDGEETINAIRAGVANSEPKSVGNWKEKLGEKQ